MTDRKDNIVIYQTRLVPPHFRVVIEDTVWNLKPVSRFDLVFSVSIGDIISGTCHPISFMLDATVVG